MVQNLGRAIVKKLTIKISGNEVMSIHDSDVVDEFCNRWCKREHVECDALKDWKLNIFKIIDRRIFFYSQNTNMLPR